jgi:colanic acid biosynthesis glycosyl transferase WcaI
MRVLINDFGGYPFPIQLSKFLAGPDCEVLHTYVSNIQTPHGNMNNEAQLAHLTITPILLKTQFGKYSFWGRFKGELEFAHHVSRLIDDFRPDIFISANTPLFAQGKLLKKCRHANINFIYWCQDIHSIALAGYLQKRLPLLAKPASLYFKRKEIKLLKQSNYVITIAPSFNEIFEQWGIRNKKMTVIQNWAPINELPVRLKHNNWSKKQQLEDKLVVLYSGTLGLKHNPLQISDAAQYFADQPDIVFVVISEGIGAEILAEQKRVLGLNNLRLLPYQDYEQLPEVLGCADILLSILEPDAAMFSVPSKVLTYLCAEKPIVLSVPKQNLSARIVESTGAGYCAEPGNAMSLNLAIAKMIADPAMRKAMGEKGRAFAEKHFEIEGIAKKFNLIFDELYLKR